VVDVELSRSIPVFNSVWFTDVYRSMKIPPMHQ